MLGVIVLLELVVGKILGLSVMGYKFYSLFFGHVAQLARALL